MTLANRPNRKTMRWKGYDYRIPTFYFVTICTATRDPILGRISADAAVMPTVAGQVVLDVLTGLSNRFPVEVSASVLMPDHLHVILWIEPVPSSPTLGAVIGAFKSLSWRRVRDVTGNADPLWQRGYHAHVIRSDSELERIHAYIAENPVRWLATQEASSCP